MLQTYRAETLIATCEAEEVAREVQRRASAAWREFVERGGLPPAGMTERQFLGIIEAHIWGAIIGGIRARLKTAGEAKRLYDRCRNQPDRTRRAPVKLNGHELDRLHEMFDGWGRRQVGRRPELVVLGGSLADIGEGGLEPFISAGLSEIPELEKVSTRTAQPFRSPSLP